LIQPAGPSAEDALYDSPVLCSFAGVYLGRAAAPDETTILNFRHLLEKHERNGKIFDTVNQYLDSKGIRIATGTIVDATIIAFLLSPRQEEGTRPRDAPDEERQPVLLRHKGAYQRE